MTKLTDRIDAEYRGRQYLVFYSFAAGSWALLIRPESQPIAGYISPEQAEQAARLSIDDAASAAESLA